MLARLLVILLEMSVPRFLSRRLVAALCAAPALFLLPPIAGASVLIDNLESGKHQTIVAYGTSLTAGGQWVSDLRGWLAAAYPGLTTVINSGQGSKASNTGVQTLNSLVLNKNPDTVIIEFSMNDASTNYTSADVDGNPPITLARSRSNLETMISRIKAQNPLAEVILMTMNIPWNSPNGSGISATVRPDLLDYYQVYRDVAAEQNLLLVDNYQTWKTIYDTNLTTYRGYVPDGVHPTASAATLVTFNNLKTALVAVPEPATILLVAGGLLGVTLLGRRHRRAGE